MFFFQNPESLFIVPIVFVFGYIYKSRFNLTLVRLLIVFLFLTAISQPHFKFKNASKKGAILFDTSESFLKFNEEDIQGWKDSIKLSSEDNIKYYGFANSVVEFDELTELESFEFRKDSSNLAKALSYISKDTENLTNLLLITDGIITDDFAKVLQNYASNGIKVDYFIKTSNLKNDSYIKDVISPEKASLGSFINFETKIYSPRSQKIKLDFFIAKKAISSKEFDLVTGVNTLIIPLKIVRPSLTKYTIKISPKDDPIEENNYFSKWVAGVDESEVLLIENSKSSPSLASFFRDKYVEVTTVNPLKVDLNPQHLRGKKLVVLNNIHAGNLKIEFVNSLVAYVSSYGGGLLMLGGNQTFSVGGWVGSNLEKILPIYLTSKDEIRAHPVAIGIALDRSGSMGAIIDGGASKMQVANEAVARVISYLKDNDEISVFGVDVVPQEIVPLVTVGKSRGAIQDAVLSLQSGGGGIYVFNGLKALQEQIVKSKHKRRHLLLFADARDAEQPGEYEELIAELVKDDVTVSTIGLGTDKDSDAELLIDIAKRGKGRSLFTDNAAELPDLFVQDVSVYSEESFIKEPILVSFDSDAKKLNFDKFVLPAKIGNYNLSYPKMGVNVGIVTKEDDPKPLVAFSEKGAGRIGVVMFSPFGSSGNDAPYFSILNNLANWIRREMNLPGVYKDIEQKSDTVTVSLEFDDTWTDIIQREEIKSFFTNLQGKKIKNFEWTSIKRNKFIGEFEFIDKTPVMGSFKIGENIIPIGPLYPKKIKEWEYNKYSLKKLIKSLKATGGREVYDVAKWEIQSGLVTFFPLNWYLIPFIILLVIYDIYVSLRLK